MDIVNAGSPYVQAAGALGGAGADIYGLYNNIRNVQAQRQTANVMRDPKAVSNFANQIYQPLSDAALAQVNRGLNANLAMRGLTAGQYPNSIVANAMASTEAQRRQAAMEMAMKSLGGVSGALPPYDPMSASGNVLRSLAALRQIRGPQQPGIGNLPVPSTGGGTPGGMSGGGAEGDMYSQGFIDPATYGGTPIPGAMY